MKSHTILTLFCINFHLHFPPASLPGYSILACIHLKLFFFNKKPCTLSGFRWFSVDHTLISLWNIFSVLVISVRVRIYGGFLQISHLLELDNSRFIAQYLCFLWNYIIFQFFKHNEDSLCLFVKLFPQPIIFLSYFCSCLHSALSFQFFIEMSFHECLNVLQYSSFLPNFRLLFLVNCFVVIPLLSAAIIFTILSKLFISVRLVQWI